MENIIELKPESFEDEVLNTSGIVLVNFYAHWCGDCRAFEPIYKELFDEYKDRIKFTQLHVNGGNPYTARYRIREVPTIIVFRDGEEIERMVDRSKTVIKWQLELILNKE